MKSLHKFISNLDNSLQNELWDESIGEKKISKMKGDYCRSRFIIYSENYLDFLTEVAFAENLTWLKDYIDRRRVMGSISPSGYRTIFSLDKEEINESEILKVIVVMHYITFHYFHLIN